MTNRVAIYFVKKYKFQKYTIRYFIFIMGFNIKFLILFIVTLVSLILTANTKWFYFENKIDL